jgi:mono/diheme cytochrome c family protein
MRYIVLTSTLFLSILAAAAQDGRTVGQTQFPPSFMPSGQEMYKQFCAACHGADAKGDGPAAAGLKTRPSDLTTLAKRHGGKFPYDYVSTILRFGPGLAAHGSSNMPTWGPIFSIIEKSNEKAVQERVKRLSAYLASLQEK